MISNNRPHYQRWYNLAAWKRLAAYQLQMQPLCQISLEFGNVVAADVVDHIVPHKGNWDLFIDPNNLQSVSKKMHDTICQAMENGTYTAPYDDNGWPIETEYLKKIYIAKKPIKRHTGVLNKAKA